MKTIATLGYKQMNPSVRVVAIKPQRGHRLPGLKSFSESRLPGRSSRNSWRRTSRVSRYIKNGRGKKILSVAVEPKKSPVISQRLANKRRMR